MKIIISFNLFFYWHLFLQVYDYCTYCIIITFITVRRYFIWYIDEIFFRNGFSQESCLLSQSNKSKQIFMTNSSCGKVTTASFNELPNDFTTIFALPSSGSLWMKISFNLVQFKELGLCQHPILIFDGRYFWNSLKKNFLLYLFLFLSFSHCTHSLFLRLTLFLLSFFFFIFWSPVFLSMFVFFIFFFSD